MIKPEFFDDPDIADLSPLARLCFIGLWVQADKAGLLIDDPRRLKVRLFPYDDVDVSALIDELAAKAMVLRYSVENKAYLSVVKFLKHQRPHPKEPDSMLPPVPAVKKHGEKCLNTARTSESGVLSLDSGVLSSEDGTRRAAASPRPVAVENENVRVMTRIAHEVIKKDPNAGFADLKADLKDACAELHIRYDSEVAGKALESALAQRKAAS